MHPVRILLGGFSRRVQQETRGIATFTLNSNDSCASGWAGAGIVAEVVGERYDRIRFQWDQLGTGIVGVRVYGKVEVV